MALIEIEDVKKIYVMGETEVQALAGVNISIEQGEFVAIMGASGSGKSTLMNVIGCLDRPSAGHYRLAGREVGTTNVDDRAEIRNKMIGFVFQNFNLLARTSALENVELPLLYQGVPGRERKKRALEALTRVGLGDRTDHTPSQLSGGQQQRVAIARAIVVRPKLILADEPTGALDSKTSVDVMRMLHDLWQSGITVIVVTHAPEVGAHAKRLISMRDGLVLKDVEQEPVVA